MNSDSLTKEQLEQMDFVDNTIFEMLKEVTKRPDLEWDIRTISEIRDRIIEEYYPSEDDEFKFYPFFYEEEIF